MVFLNEDSHIILDDMHHVIWRRHNYKNLRLTQQNAYSGENVEVFKKDGTTVHKRWLGFISRDAAKSIQGVSVKLAAFKVDQTELADGQRVHGCVVAHGAYAVIDTSVVVL